mmetsp:Transcript_5383/g.17902  ORF Transcript_5383/g.17902 Transcript_5383/m.17902 type:complete len:271 (+) Transcript_5383:358-1170(+)
MVPPSVAGSRAAVGLNTDGGGTPAAADADTRSAVLPSPTTGLGGASNRSLPPCSLERMLSASCNGLHRRRSASAVCTSSPHTGHMQPRQPPRSGGRWAARPQVWPHGSARTHGARPPLPDATAASASRESAHVARQSPWCEGCCERCCTASADVAPPPHSNWAGPSPAPPPATSPNGGGVISPEAGLSRLAPARSSGSAGPKLPASAACAITLRHSSEPAESICRLHAQKKPRRARESATQMRLSTEVKPSLPWALERTRERSTRSFSSP